MTRKAGQLIQRGERTWLVRIYLGTDGRGKRRYLNRTVHGSKKDAEAVLHQLLAERDKGALPRESGPKTLGELLDEWMEAVRAKDRATTAAKYEEMLNLYVRPYLSGLRLSRLQGRDLTLHYRSLSERGLGPRTIRYAHSLIHAALNYALKQGYIAANPAQAAVLPRQVRREAQVLSPEQAQAFIRAAEERWEGLPLIIMLAAGIRPSEALGLRWRDVSEDCSELYLRRASHGRDADDETKTPSSRRRLPLDRRPAALLREWREQQAMLRTMLGSAWAGEDYVFTTEEGRPLGYSGLRKRFKLLLQKAGLPESVRLYDLRHSHATALLLAGVPLKVVQERLGHSSITLTADTYSHVLPTMQDEAAEKVGDLFFPET